MGGSPRLATHTSEVNVCCGINMTHTHTLSGIFLSGFDVTSNVQAGFLFGIPVTGTMAHSYVTSFNSLKEVWPQVCIPFVLAADID